MSYPGVTKTYAIQAGRELRVIVGADKMSDEDSTKLSNEIAEKIQNEMIALFLKKHIDKLNDIAILYRTNSEAQQLAVVLNGYGITTTIDKSDQSIFSAKSQ